MKQKFSAERVYALYDFIHDYNQQYGQIPTFKEMVAALEISPATLHRYFEKMERMGMLRRPNGKARAITLITRKADWNALVEPLPGEKPPLEVVVG